MRQDVVGSNPKSHTCDLDYGLVKVFRVAYSPLIIRCLLRSSGFLTS